MSPIAVTHALDAMLASLLDAEAMTARLRTLLDRPDLIVVEPVLLDHKPEHRAVVRYRTMGSGGLADINGKVYADRAQAPRVHQFLAQLAECYEPRSLLCTPQPLGIDSSIGMVLYTPISGRPLDTLASTPELPRALESAARWLAALHRSGIQLDRRFDVEHEASAAEAWTELVAYAHPAAAANAGRLAAGLRASRTDVQLNALAPIHKDFHYQHVIVGDRVGVVDLDEARMGDATFDLAHFVANLRLLAFRTGIPASDRARWEDTFLDTYASITGWRREAVGYAWCTGYTCAKIAKQLATGRGPRPRPEGDERAAQIDAILTEGLACLEP